MKAMAEADGRERHGRHDRLIREEARPIRRILDEETGELVGWLYEWNTGERMAMWKDGKREDVVYG